MDNLNKESTVEKFNKIDDQNEINGYNTKLNGYSNDNDKLNKKSIDKTVQTINKKTESKNTKRKELDYRHLYIGDIAMCEISWDTPLE